MQVGAAAKVLGAVRVVVPAHGHLHLDPLAGVGCEQSPPVILPGRGSGSPPGGEAKVGRADRSGGAAGAACPPAEFALSEIVVELAGCEEQVVGALDAVASRPSPVQKRRSWAAAREQISEEIAGVPLGRRHADGRKVAEQIVCRPVARPPEVIRGAEQQREDREGRGVALVGGCAESRKAAAERERLRHAEVLLAGGPEKVGKAAKGGAKKRPKRWPGCPAGCG